MTEGIDQVRAVLAATEDVDLPDDLQRQDSGADHAAHDSRPDDGDRGMDQNGGPDDAPPHPPGEDDAFWRRVEKAAEQPLNDIGNGRRLAIHFGDGLMWVPRVGWFTWTGAVWAKDPDIIKVREKAHQISPLIERETSFIRVPPAKAALVASREMVLERLGALLKTSGRTPEQDTELDELKHQRDEIDRLLNGVQDKIGQRLRHAKNAGNSGPIGNMMVEGGIGLARQLEELDASDLEVNTLLGVLRFSVTADKKNPALRTASVELVPHDQKQLLTKIMPVEYDPGSPTMAAPRFYKFLDRIMPDAEMQRFLQRVFGLAMTGLTGDQMLCFFYGMGANGKSVLIDLMARIFGDYAATAKIESLTGTNRRGGGDATPDLVPLIGARFVRASEPDEGVKWQEGLIKDLTGGEPIMVRALHSDFVNFRPKFKLIISGNHKPDIRGTDDGIWRRLKLVEFDQQIPVEERIKKDEMDALLWEERNGVFSWLVEGLLDYLEGGIAEPDRVKLATATFREESDPFGTFLDDACLITGDGDDRLSALDLVNAFHFWLGSNGGGSFRDGTISRAIKDRSLRWRSRKTGQKFTQSKSNGIMRYNGIRFTDVFQKLWNDAPKDQKGKPLFSSTAGSGSQGGDDGLF